MKLFLKIILSIIGLLLILLIGGFVYINNFLPNVKPAQDIRINSNPEMIERGKYLANHVTLCMDCHAERDWRYFSGPPKNGTLGAGGDVFDENMGFPGTFFAKNITPYALKNWTDGEIYRALTVGVNKNGEPLFPLMPYINYHILDPEDLKSIIAYIRTLKPIEKNIPERKINFPMNLILRTIPNDITPGKMPSKSNTLDYGKYIATAASCIECHTPVEKGQIKPDSAFSGNREFIFPDGAILRSANITPDNETGIGLWTEEQFVKKFKQYLENSDSVDTHSNISDLNLKMIPVKPNEFNTLMPWLMYAGMTEEDLKAIYHYLKSQKPIKSIVTKFTPAKNKKS